MNSAARDLCLKGVLELGRAMQARVRDADLEAAEDLAGRRLERLQVLFSEAGIREQPEMAAYWIQEILREDRELMNGLEKLRQRMELELGQLRNSARSALEYAEVERG